MIKIIFYKSFDSKEVKYLQSNKGSAENSPLENTTPRPPEEKIFRRLVNLNEGK